MDKPSAMLRNQSFVVLLGVGALNSTGRWLDMLVIAIFVLDRTGSPLIVASMLMLRLLPMSLFGMFGGILAQRFERWRILNLASACLAGLALAMYALSDSGTLQVWHAGVASFLSGLVWSTDFPVRRTLMSDIAGPERVSRAMSLDILAGSTTRMLGPLLGGMLYQNVGLGGAFLLSASLYSTGLVWLLVRSWRGRLAATAVRATDVADLPSLSASLREGWQALRASPSLPGILAVTVVFNLWGFPFVSMVPVFGKEILGLNDAMTGLLASAEGAGALIGAVILSLFARSEHSRYLYFGAVSCYCGFALAFSFSGWTWLSTLLLLLVGLVSAAFGAMQSALVLMNAPRGYERQMMGVLSVCIGTAPLGFLHMGLLADWLGTPLACAITAAEGLLAMAIVLWRWPHLLSRQPLPG